MTIISFALIGLIGLAVLAIISYWIAWFTDPKFRERERQNKPQQKKWPN